MTAIGLFQIVVFFLLVLAVTKPLGIYMARVFQGERTFLRREVEGPNNLKWDVRTLRAQMEAEMHTKTNASKR